MLRSFFVTTIFLATACSSSSSGGSVSGADASIDAGVTPSGPGGASCATLPSSAKNAGSGCTSPSGMFTQVTFDTVAGTYNQTCSTPPYASQAEFDANEGTSGAAGTVIKSNEDYVVTAGCASGSIAYQTTGAPKTTIVFIWTKAP